MNREQRRQAARQGSNPTADVLSSLHRQRIPGGCDDCRAYQTMDATHAPLYTLRVHHDDTCPTFRAMEARR